MESSCPLVSSSNTAQLNHCVDKATINTIHIDRSTAQPNNITTDYNEIDKLHIHQFAHMST